VKAAYRKASLIYHPDKVGAAKYDDAAEKIWLKVRNAHDVL